MGEKILAFTAMIQMVVRLGQPGGFISSLGPYAAL